MRCSRSTEDIQAFIDGTLGPIRVAELEQHLEQCERCRALERDLRQIRHVAATLGDPEPPDHVWLQIAGRLRQQGRVHDQPVVETTGHHQYVWLAIAASLVLAVGTALMLLVPQFSSRQNGTEAVSGNAAASATVQSGVEDLMKAEQLLQSGIAKLEQGIGNDGEGLPPEVTATLKTNLKILDQAIAESTDAVQKEPNNLAARSSLFDALQRKIALLQDTITLMNEMRKGNAAGVAHVVEGTKKS